jgi:hypothetical protein
LYPTGTLMVSYTDCPCTKTGCKLRKKVKMIRYLVVAIIRIDTQI